MDYLYMMEFSHISSHHHSNHEDMHHIYSHGQCPHTEHQRNMDSSDTTLLALKQTKQVNNQSTTVAITDRRGGILS